MQTCRSLLGRVLFRDTRPLVCAAAGRRGGLCLRRAAAHNPGTTVALPHDPFAHTQRIASRRLLHGSVTTETASLGARRAFGSGSDTDSWAADSDGHAARGYSRHQFEHFKDHALKILSARPHGEGELQQKLHVACLRRKRRKQRSAARGRISDDYGTCRRRRWAASRH